MQWTVHIAIHHCNIAEQHTVWVSKVSQGPSYFPLFCQEGSGSHLACFLPPWRLSRAAGTYTCALQKRPLAETSRRRDRGGMGRCYLPTWKSMKLFFYIFSEIMYTQHDSSNKFRVCGALGSSAFLIALWDVTCTLTYIHICIQWHTTHT